MKKIIISIVILVSTNVFSQIGIGTKTVEPSAILELKSLDKALLIPRVTNTAAIATPANAMMVFDQSSNCFKVYYNDKWTDCLGMGINAVLAQIGYEADNPNTIPSIVTVSQLASIPGVIGVNPILETQYQSYIDNNPDLFSRPATVEEVNAMLAD